MKKLTLKGIKWEGMAFRGVPIVADGDMEKKLTMEDFEKLYTLASEYEEETVFTNKKGDKLILLDEKIIFIKASQKEEKI